MNSRKFLIIFLLIALIFLSACSGVSLLTQKDHENEFLQDQPLKGTIHLSNSTEETLYENTEDVLLSFFTGYYESLAKLEEEDITSFFNIEDPESFENASINQGALNYLVNHRKLQSNDLTMKSYDLEIDILAINKPARNTIEINLKEHRKINFNFIPDINSYTSSIQQEFILYDTKEGWKIQNYTRFEDINYLINELYLEAKEEENYSEEFSGEIIKTILTDLLTQSEENVKEISRAKEIYFSQYNQDLKIIYDEKWDNDYNRNNAVAYANKWVSPNSIVRNPDWFTYDDYGGNCANYTSQSLFAGGIPMDYYGRPQAQWKWYDNSVNERRVLRGRAPAWTGVNEFYRYSLTNSGYGLVSVLDDNYYNGEIGDIILFGTDLRWKHAVIITGVVKDEEGRVVDYLINSNTTDRINYPVSAYSYSKIQLVKILGWNS